MSIPNLLFPVTVTIDPIDKAETEYDRVAREPVFQVARKATITIPAQVAWMGRGGTEMSGAGRISKSSGYLVMLTVDIAARSYTPTHGDRITNIPGETGTYYVTMVTPAIHRDGTNKAMRIDFMDRQPAHGVAS